MEIRMLYNRVVESNVIAAADKTSFAQPAVLGDGRSMPCILMINHFRRIFLRLLSVLLPHVHFRSTDIRKKTKTIFFVTFCSIERSPLLHGETEYSVLSPFYDEMFAFFT